MKHLGPVPQKWLTSDGHTTFHKRLVLRVWIHAILGLECICKLAKFLCEELPNLLPQTQSVAPQNDTMHPSWRRSWCFSSSFNASAAFVCSSCREANGSWNLDRRCSSLARRWERCIRHAKTIPALSLWSGGLDALRKHDFIHTTFSAERHQHEKVLPPWSCLLKNASNPLMHEGRETLWTRCNEAKSINLQLSHAPESSIIRFISGLLTGAGRKDAILMDNVVVFFPPCEKYSLF